MLIRIWCQVIYNRTLTNSHLPHNRRHGSRKFITLEGCPNLAHDKLSRSTKDIPSPRKTRSVSESRFTRHFDNGNTRPAKPPAVPTNPDRSCTYLVLRAHRISQATSKTSPRVAPWWPRRLLSSDQHSKEHWPGGVKIKMTLGLRKTKGKRAR